MYNYIGELEANMCYLPFSPKIKVAEMDLK